MFKPSRHSLRIAALCSAGMLLLTFSLVAESPAARPKLWSILLAEAGIACLVTAIAESALLAGLIRELRSEVKVLLDNVRKDYDVVTHALRNGVQDVLDPRRINPTGAWQAFVDALRPARGDVWIEGVCLKDFLDGSNPVSRELRRMLQDDEAINVKLLVLDPTSDAAYIRSAVEQNRIPYEDGQLFADVTASMASLREFYDAAAKKERFKIEARFYNVDPHAYLFGTPDTLFLEAYHLGPLPGDGPCIGGFVPIIRYKEGSTMYARMHQHFQTIWHARPATGQATPVHGCLQVRTLEEVEHELRRLRYAAMSAAVKEQV